MAKKVETYTADQLQFEEESVPAEALQFEDDKIDADGKGVVGKAWEAATAPIPGIGKVADFLQNELPGAIAEKSGELSSMAGPLGPIIQQKGVDIAGSISLVSNLIPKTPLDVGMYLLGGGVIGKGGRAVARIIPPQIKDAIFTKMAIPAIEKAQAATGAMAGATGDMLADVAGILFGKNREVVKALYKKPGAIWSKATELFSIKRQELLNQKIAEGLSERGKQFSQLEEEFAGFVKPSSAERVKAEPIINEIITEMKRRGHYIPKSVSGENPIAIGRFPENSSEATAIFEKLGVIKNNPNMEFGQALNLRRQIDDMIEYGIEGSSGLKEVSGEGNRILQLIRRRLNSRMQDSIPKDMSRLWAEANFSYSRARKAYGELRKQVVKGDPQGTENKLLKLIKDGRFEDEVMSRAEKLGESVAKELDDIRDMIVAKQFRPWAEGGTGAGLFKSGFMPTSPRIGGYGISAAGALGKLPLAATKTIITNPGASSAGAVGLDNITKNK